MFQTMCQTMFRWHFFWTCPFFLCVLAVTFLSGEKKRMNKMFQMFVWLSWLCFWSCDYGGCSVWHMNSFLCPCFNLLVWLILHFIMKWDWSCSWNAFLLGIICRRCLRSTTTKFMLPNLAQLATWKRLWKELHSHTPFVKVYEKSISAYKPHTAVLWALWQILRWLALKWQHGASVRSPFSFWRIAL